MCFRKRGGGVKQVLSLLGSFVPALSSHSEKEALHMVMSCSIGSGDGPE